MRKHDADAYARASRNSTCSTALLTQCTDGRTYGLTKKHLTVRWIGFATSRARAYTHFDDFSGEA
jgi:hypothetical protein